MRIRAPYSLLLSFREKFLNEGIAFSRNNLLYKLLKKYIHSRNFFLNRFHTTRKHCRGEEGKGSEAKVDRLH